MPDVEVQPNPLSPGSMVLTQTDRQQQGSEQTQTSASRACDKAGGGSAHTSAKEKGLVHKARDEHTAHLNHSAVIKTILPPCPFPEDQLGVGVGGAHFV